MKENSISSLKERCTGCSACANSCPQKCIHMQADKEGFVYPEIDVEQCIHCGLCDRNCPVLSQSYSRHSTFSTYAVLHKDTSVWEASSSGGAFSALCEAFFELHPNGKVYGAAFDENHVVRHCAVERLSDIAAFRKSKYVQSDIGHCYQSVHEDLKAGRAVLFSGTPCQIGGLNEVVRLDNTDNLYCVDLICHGVGSPKVFQRHIWELEQKAHSALETFRFRIRSVKRGVLNWYCTESVYADGNQIVFEQDPYVQSFIAGLCLRLSCGSCLFTNTERPGDISLGDLKGKFDLFPEDKSVTNWSVVLCNSQKGQRLFERASSHCFIKSVDLEQFMRYSPPLKYATPAPAQRSDFFKMFLNGGTVEECANNYIPQKSWVVRLWMQLPDSWRARIKRMLRKRKGLL